MTLSFSEPTAAHLLHDRLGRLRASPAEGSGQRTAHHVPHSRAHGDPRRRRCHLRHEARLARRGRGRGSSGGRRVRRWVRGGWTAVGMAEGQGKQS